MQIKLFQDKWRNTVKEYIALQCNSRDTLKSGSNIQTSLDC